MTKHTKPKKSLSFTRETVRRLQDAQLADVAGGWTSATNQTDCYACPSNACKE